METARALLDTKTANALAYLATSLLRAIEVSDLESRLEALERTQQLSFKLAHRAESYRTLYRTDRAIWTSWTARVSPSRGKVRKGLGLFP
jgi:hypothetical protein